jgi:uncharacterized protein
MKRIWIACLLFFSAALVLAPARAASAANRGINDNANFFSEDGRRKANEIIDNIYKQHRAKEVLIETFEAVPEGMPYDQFVRQHFQQARLNGVYIMIVRKGAHVSVRADSLTDSVFTNTVCSSIAQRLAARMREIKKPPYDAALVEAVQSIADTFRGVEKGGATAAPRSSPGAYPPAAGNRPQGRSGGSWLPSSITGWICLGVGVWIVFALIRSVMRRRTGGYGGAPGAYGQMGGGPGYGGGYGGGGNYGGGGFGGGWGSSLLGGLFGAAAGNWLYDRFGRSGGSAYGAPPADTGTYSGGDQASTPDWAGPGDSGLGGGSGGDASFGGGGDDFGGGGDAGGGGDFGGGGGDFGGGGDAGGGGDFA